MIWNIPLLESSDGTHSAPATVPVPTAVAPGGLYHFLRHTSVESSGGLVFDVDRLWSLDAPCAQPGVYYNVVVYLLFVREQSMDSCISEMTRPRFAVDAAVYASRPSGTESSETGETCSMAFLFTHLSPLVGPMTYRQVERAVEHYFGWCSKSSTEKMPMSWKKNVYRMTIELVPSDQATDWVKAREKAFEQSSLAFATETRGFKCRPPCPE